MTSAEPSPVAPLLRPLDLGPRQAPNRVFFGPHETNLGRRRSISERHVAYYRARAEGGAGVIVTEEASVHPSDWPYERCPLARDCGPGWAAVASAVEEHGTLALAALGHSGGQGTSAYSQLPLWAPSRIPEVNTREVPKWMEPDDIDQVIEAFGASAALATGSGMAGVEVNAGQFSLIRQFLSGLTNQRQDEWGQDKTLFARQVLQSVRDSVGRGAVVGLRLSCDELAPWAGIVPEAAAELAAALSPWIDYLTVVRGSIFSVSATRPDSHTQPGFNLALLAPLRRALPPQVALVAQGSIVDAAGAAAAIEAGAAAVEMTRAQIAEPGLVARWNRGEEPRPCILCNQACQVRDVRNPIVSCVGEPRSGHETEDPRADGTTPRPVGTRPSVLVVGGGPAGLECARVAALAGAEVRLVEASGGCGGMLSLAARGSGRSRLGLLAQWLEAECRRLGVEVILGQMVRPVDVEAHRGPVVLATGGRPGERPYPVSRGARVVTAAQFLAGPDPRPAGVWAVWDPVGGPVAISVAETLAAAGCRVHLVTPDLIPGNELARTGDLAPANTRLQAVGVTLEKRSLLRRVRPGQIVLEDRFSGAVRQVEVDGFIDAGYRLPEDSLWRRTGERHVRVGDAVAPRSIYEAVLEGRRAGLVAASGMAS